MDDVDAACRGKHRWVNRAEAEKALARRNKRRVRHRDNRKPAVDLYRCKHCGGWHIGGRKI